ncbi:oxidoreductase [Lactobacillus selangorensis]|uniref:Oxidoreductase n=1 Tax=Lactobacillus selangorensis TaxID=81857 RepID=A0A0R2FX56_9LACO|nr:Gfo/Idh/MocA family oxidoreductase [Lactobacillus selangorensis]KRN28142.1 oxidoreductase [Lactobacillus selangorensis]KRN30981.1 oxidoreductase [Lactobacillus selangorensis]
MKLALFGSGMIVSDMLTMIGDVHNVQLEAILGTQHGLPTMQKLAAQYQIPKIYTELSECLADPNVDTVYIGLPNFLHYSYAKQALEAGKNVICEKPFTLNAGQARDLANLAQRKNLILVEAISNQYFNNYQQIQADLPKLGSLKIIDCNYSQYSSRYDAFKHGNIQTAFDPKKGGGALMDLNIYNIHFVVGLLGAPTQVHYFANIDHGIDTSGILLLEYPGLKVVCTGAKDCAAPVRSTIEGDQGDIEVIGPTNTLEKFTEHLRNQDTVTVDKRIHPHRMYQEFAAFTKMIDTHDMAEADRRMAHSLTVMDVVDAALADAQIKLG